MFAEVGLKLTRIAERAGWDCVVEYHESGCWVIDRNPETSFEVALDSDLGIILATVDVVGMDQIGSTTGFEALLLKTNAAAKETGGLFFSLAADGSQILLTAPLPSAISDDALMAALDALHERADNWASVITAPAKPSDGDFVSDNYIRA